MGVKGPPFLEDRMEKEEIQKERQRTASMRGVILDSRRHPRRRNRWGWQTLPYGLLCCLSEGCIGVALDSFVAEVVAVTSELAMVETPRYLATVTRNRLHSHSIASAGVIPYGGVLSDMPQQEVAQRRGASS